MVASKRSGMTRLVSVLLIFIFVLAQLCADTVYTIKSGDAIEKIAHRFNVSQRELLARNGLTAKSCLQIGQKLRIPDKPKPKQKPIKPVKPKAAKPVKATKPAKPAKHAQTAKSAKTTKPAKTATTRAATTNARKLFAERQRLVNERQRHGKKLASTAAVYLGTPYVWGGTTSRGMDCSGLIYRIMLCNGRTVPHSSAQLFKMGTPVKAKDLQPGDLVFFSTGRAGGGVNHVGIWIGHNTFIHASSGQGRVVKQPMAGFYLQRLKGARRL